MVLLEGGNEPEDARLAAPVDCGLAIGSDPSWACPCCCPWPPASESFLAMLMLRRAEARAPSGLL